MIYRLQFVLGVMLIAIGAQQDYWVYGVGGVAFGIALLTPLHWWQKRGDVRQHGARGVDDRYRG